MGVSPDFDSAGLDYLQLTLPTNIDAIVTDFNRTCDLLHRQYCFLTLFRSLASFKPHSLSNAVSAKQLSHITVVLHLS